MEMVPAARCSGSGSSRLHSGRPAEQAERLGGLERSSRWPSQRSATDHVQVQVRHGVACVLSDVEDKAEAAAELFASSDLASGREHRGQKIAVRRLEGGRIDEVGARNYQYMRWRDWGDVTKCDHAVVLIDELRRERTGEDGAKQALFRPGHIAGHDTQRGSSLGNQFVTRDLQSEADLVRKEPPPSGEDKSALFTADEAERDAVGGESVARDAESGA